MDPVEVVWASIKHALVIPSSCVLSTVQHTLPYPHFNYRVAVEKRQKVHFQGKDSNKKHNRHPHNCGWLWFRKQPRKELRFKEETSSAELLWIWLWKFHKHSVISAHFHKRKGQFTLLLLFSPKLSKSSLSDIWLGKNGLFSSEDFIPNRFVARFTLTL